MARRPPPPVPHGGLPGLPPGSAGLLLRLWRWIVDSHSGDPFAHAATHRPDSVSDPLATAAPTQATGPVASAGTAGTLLRSDATIQQGIVVAKGDILGHSSVPARVPVGANGQVLTADSAEALGVKWATPAAGGGAAATLTSAQQEQADLEVRAAFESLALRDVVARAYR